ncbi:MAG: VOC family protein [Novosphingobium sp.]
MLTLARCGTNDLPRARVFHDAVASVLGASVAFEQDDFVAYKGPNGGMFMVGKPFAGEACFGNGTQFGLTAPDRATVDAVHAKALELGGTCEGKPGLRGPEEMNFYACYFRDLDGNKMMVYSSPNM